jgi:hypothetical protein
MLFGDSWTSNIAKDYQSFKFKINIESTKMAPLHHITITITISIILLNLHFLSYKKL